MSLIPEEFEIVENNEEELEDGYGGGAVGSNFTMCKDLQIMFYVCL